MSADISTNPDVKIIPGKNTTLLSFPDRLVFACSECGHTKSIQYLQEPNILQRHTDSQDYCVCHQMPNDKLLQEIYVETGSYQTVEEVRQFILGLKSAVGR